ncbi:MAG: NADH-quinone oxidoreductase subunit NuoH [Chloroflexi bacterium]|nr:NADH-quinone oxidoreductase subunit NuoH [Chloroflexota bacterium]
MEFLNDLFVNIYNAVDALLTGLIGGMGLRPDAASAIVAAVMGLLVITVILLFGVTVVLSLIWLERKVAGRVQDRLGPNRVGPFGLLQPVADTVKMFIKEDIVPTNADGLVHLLAPIVALAPAVLAFAVIPFGRGMAPVDLNIGILWVVSVGSIGTVGLFMAGYGSNNKFALIGGMRAVAQAISYEIPQVLTIVPVILLAGSMSLVTIVQKQSGLWYVLYLPIGLIGFVIYYISALAEVNRTPFDLPEGESEIVAGHHTEYSGMKWGLFYLAEYFNFFIVCMIAATLFLGGWQGPLLPPWLWLLIKTYALILVGMWIRMTLPRFRVDQLMKFAWQVLVPIALVNILLTGVFLLIVRP